MLRDGCYFLLAQKVTKDALGAASPFTGDALLRIWHLRPAALNTRPCVLLASGTQAPKALKIGKSLRCTDTAYPGKAVAVGPPDHHRTKQVGRHQAVLDRTAEAENLGMVGPKARE